METCDRPENSSFMDTALARSTLGSTPGFREATNEREKEFLGQATRFNIGVKIGFTPVLELRMQILD